MLRWSCYLVLFAMCACGDSNKQPGGDAPTPDAASDAAPDLDARTADAARDAAVDRDGDVDAARTPDAAPADASRDAGALPDAHIADAAPHAPDARTSDAAPPDEPDAAPVSGLPCTPCSDAADCAGSGAAAACSMIFGGSFCTPACAGDVCPDGYRCVFGQCFPAGARCDSCATAPCDADRRCDVFTGTCEPRVARCGSCTAAGDCEAGLLCQPLGLGRSCLAPCDAEGACEAGFRCADGACAPMGGFCDNCGGCGGERPVCNFLTRQCLACGVGFPCPAGRICDEAGECVEPPVGQQCRTDLDCPAATRFCVDTACVACRGDGDCRGTERCDAGACVHDPCARMTCGRGAGCDPADERCETPDGSPRCDGDDDCGEDLRCNVATAQCYRADFRCGGNSECAPGGECRADPANQGEFVCICDRTNRADPMEPNDQHRVPCQPGGYCLQLGLEGVCVAPR